MSWISCTKVGTATWAPRWGGGHLGEFRTQMLVLRRQEELGGHIYLRIVRKHIFIAISGRSGGREGRPGPGGRPSHFWSGNPIFLYFFKKDITIYEGHYLKT